MDALTANNRTHRKALELDKGLFLIRFETAEDKISPPKVSVIRDQDAGSDLSFVLHPDHNEAVLWRPGASLVVRATALTRLFIEISPAHDNGSSAATVKVEPLTQGEAPAALPAQSGPQFNVASDRASFSVLGHLASIGDQLVNAGAWLGGPTAPSRIEGMAIQWRDKPADVDIRYAVKTAQLDAISGRPVSAGAFAGTRRKALPIVSLMLELSGAGSANFELDVEAIFLGAPMMRMKGQYIVLAGPTGGEPLVGLKVSLDSAKSLALGGSVPGRLGEHSGSLRVFRSRPRQDQAMAL
jgi:hypothetical protein